MKKLVYVVNYVESLESYAIGGIFDTKEVAEQVEKDLREQHQNDNGFFAGIMEVEINTPVNNFIEVYVQ